MCIKTLSKTISVAAIIFSFFENLALATAYAIPSEVIPLPSVAAATVSTVTTTKSELTLAERWKCESDHPMSCVSELTLEIMKDRHVIFVPGFLNEFARGPIEYFKSNRVALRRDLDGQFTLFSSPSWQSIHQNSETLHRRLLAIYKKSKKPVILFGHSKGAAETLYLVLRHPELILDGIVDRVVLIQAALGGSPLAYAVNSRYVVRAVYSLLGGGFKSMHPHYTKKEFLKASVYFMNFLLGRYSESKMIEVQKMISDRIFYVRSYSPTANLNFGAQFITRYLTMDLLYYGKNDGILLTHKQWLPWIGQDLGVLETDHTALTIDGMNEITPLGREAFTRALFEQIYSP